MAIIKCKMCGGDLNIVEGESICECEYCGTRQTIPSADNEKKLTLFARANRLRLASEFDKAFSIYESIVADFPEEAEAYWGLVLCKYGIEYVDDPVTGKKVPTCHRSSFDSVMEDSDFEQACENADGTARRVYREEAKQIEEIRKGILEVSGKEEAYDIFICYKETDENGNRTLDSVLAQDIYDALTDKGYRVFFSRITLEDKLGQEYEPYIFAALNSAKIMLAVGTDYEYYNAVWVKNEWSRYLKLMAKDKDKHLIPCYKNLDAYDMPKEFAKLQAQDLGKVGAVQDLLRGIEKLLGGAALQETKPEQNVVVKAEAPGVESLLKRGKLFLEDKEWESAKEYFNRVLDINPECAEAYLGLCLAQAKFTDIEKAANAIERGCFTSKNMEKAERFADNALKNRIFEAKVLLKKMIAECEEAPQRKVEERVNALFLLRKRIKPVTDCFISAGFDHSVGLQSNGSVLTAGNQDRGQCNVSAWDDIVNVSAGGHHTAGLRGDGRVLAVGDNADGQCNVSDWTDIVSISAGFKHTVGLRSDGTVVAVGNNNFRQIDVSYWNDIAAISAGYYHVVGIKKDGTIVAVGRNDGGQRNITGWTDIVSISAGYMHTVGLRGDGTVVTTGNNDFNQCNVLSWSGIIAISAGYEHTVGLRSDGTVVASGKNDSGQCDVTDWTDIVSISAGYEHTLGLRSDGTVVTTMHPEEVYDWKLFDSLKTIEQDQKVAHELFQQREWHRSQGLCPYCGGTFKGLFKKVCSQCGKPKDY